MGKKYQYDIAISFAEEDREIATNLALALELEGFKNVYYYPDKLSEVWGIDIEKKLTDIYTTKSKYSILLLSENYFQKNFTILEFKAIVQRQKACDGALYALPILVKDIDITLYPEINKLGFLKWNQNAKVIAKQIKLVFLRNDPKRNYFTKKVNFISRYGIFFYAIFSIIVVIIISVYFLLQWNKTYPLSIAPKKDTSMPGNRMKPISVQKDTSVELSERNQNKINVPLSNKENPNKVKESESVVNGISKDNTLKSNYINILNGARYEQSIHYLQFTTTEKNTIKIFGKVHLDDIVAEASLKNNTLAIYSGNVTGVLSLIDSAHCLFGYIIIKKTGEKMDINFKRE